MLANAWSMSSRDSGDAFVLFASVFESVRSFMITFPSAGNASFPLALVARAAYACSLSSLPSDDGRGVVIRSS